MSKGYYALAFIPPFMGALSYITSKYVIQDISPVALLFYRWVTAVLLLTPFLWRGFVADLPGLCRHWRLVTVVALSGVTLFNFFLYSALQFTSATNAGIIANIFPIFVLLLGRFLHQERLQIMQLIAIALAFLGVLMIATQGRMLYGLSHLFHNIGDLGALMAAFCYAIYVFGVKLKPKEIGFYSFLYAIFLWGTLLILPLYLIDLLYFEHHFALTWTIASAILILGFGVSIIGMMTLNMSILRIGPNMTSLIFYMAPFFTACAAVIVLEEEFASFHFWGMVCILLGVNLPLLWQLVRSKKNARK